MTGEDVRWALGFALSVLVCAALAPVGAIAWALSRTLGGDAGAA